LWIFDPRKGIEQGEAFQSIGYIGPTFLSLAFDGKDRVYFVQYKNNPDGRTHWTEAVRDYPREDIHFEDDLHLRSIRVEAGAEHPVVDHGKIVDQEDRHCSMIEALGADGKGHVYLHGSWDVRKTEEATRQFFWPELLQYYIELGYPAVANTYRDAKDHDYKTLSRGQFFSWGRV
jgi:hypothetical protein